jgi:predicted nucleic acid-binding protein
MGKNHKAYVDTSAFIALLDQSDSYHALFKRLFADPPSLVTSPLVLTEGHAWFLRRYGSYRGLQFLSFIEDLKPLVIAPVSERDMKGAFAVLRAFPDQDLTLADAVGLFFMKQLKLKVCWSIDYHLGLTKVPLIIHEHG